jgi:hypothetical protein
VLGALVRSCVPDGLSAGPRIAEQLAVRTGLHADAMLRTLRCVALQAYFRLRNDGRF